MTDKKTVEMIVNKRQAREEKPTEEMMMKKMRLVCDF